MAVTGVHALIYTPEADAVRRVLDSVFGWPHVNAGDGWPIFALPPGEVGVHPGDTPRYELALMCDDIAAEMIEMRAQGIAFRGEPETQAWGLSAVMILPGGLEMMLYQPRHPTAHKSGS